MKRTSPFAVALLVLVVLSVAPAWAADPADPCGAAVNNLIAPFFKKQYRTADDLARIRLAYKNLRSVSPEALEAAKKVLTALASGPPGDVSGVANPLQGMRAFSGGWTSNPTALEAYLLGLARYTYADPSAPTGLVMANGLQYKALTSGSSSNLRRVAGGAGSKAEAFEVAAAVWLENYFVTYGGYAPGQIKLESFGEKVLFGGLQVEADNLFRNLGTSKLIVVDQKHTLKDAVSSVSGSLVDNWVEGLRLGAYEKIIAATNEPPSNALMTMIANKLSAAKRPPDDILVILVYLDGF